MEWIKNLKFILMPHYWIMNEPYNERIDEYVNFLFDNYPIVRSKINDNTVFLGGVEIWVSNQPYSCLMPYEYKFDYRPSRNTIYKRLKQVNSFLKECKKKELEDFINKNHCSHTT